MYLKKFLNQVKNGNKEIDLEEEDIKEWIDSLKPEDFERNIEFLKSYNYSSPR